MLWKPWLAKCWSAKCKLYTTTLHILQKNLQNCTDCKKKHQKNSCRVLVMSIVQVPCFISRMLRNNCKMRENVLWCFLNLTAFWKLPHSEVQNYPFQTRGKKTYINIPCQSNCMCFHQLLMSQIIPYIRIWCYNNSWSWGFVLMASPKTHLKAAAESTCFVSASLPGCYFCLWDCS